MMAYPIRGRGVAVLLCGAFVFMAAPFAPRAHAQVSEDKVVELVNYLWYPYDREPRERAQIRAKAVAELVAMVGTHGKALADRLRAIYERPDTEPDMKANVVRTMNRVAKERPDSDFTRQTHRFCSKLLHSLVLGDVPSRVIWIEAANNLKLNRDLSVVPAYVERFTDPDMTARFRKARVESFNVLMGTRIHPLSVQRTTRLDDLREHWMAWWQQNKPYAEYYFPTDPKTGKRVWRRPGIRINRLKLASWSLKTKLLIASAGADDTVRLWDGRDGVAGHVLYGAAETVVGLAIHPKGSLAAGGDALGHLRVWHIVSGELDRQFQAHRHSIWDLDFDPAGNRLASAGGDGRVCIWDVRTWKRERSVRVGDTTVYTARFSPDGTWVAAGTRAGTVHLIPVGAGAQPRTLEPQPALKQDPIYAVAYRPDGSQLAAATRGGTVQIWDVGSGKRLKRLKVGSDPVTGVGWITKGQALVTGDMGARVLAWNLQARKVYRGYQSRGEPIYSLAVSPDGKWLAVGGRNRLVTMWSVHEGARLRILAGHYDAVMKVRFAPKQTTMLMKGSPRFGYVVDWLRTNSYYAVEAPSELRQRSLGDFELAAPTLKQLVPKIAHKVGCKLDMTEKTIRFQP